MSLCSAKSSSCACVNLFHSFAFVIDHQPLRPLLGVDAQDVVEVINEAEQYYSEFCAGFLECGDCLAAVNVSASGERYKLIRVLAII